MNGVGQSECATQNRAIDLFRDGLGYRYFSEIVSLEAKLAKAHQLKQGMMQELLTGRIRLIRPSKSEGSAQC